MNAEEIQRIRKREPFVPFRLALKDGRKLEVSRRDLILVTKDSLSIGILIDPISGIPEQIIHISPLQVIGIEDLEPAA
ncbi:MAG: hypothetical protein HY735_18290 [Verrucomicrobia bacterium]|nr:hypothetical protein [Verrucomicrobiota bacterium]